MLPDAFSHHANRLALEIFRLNGALISAGDALVAPLGLTSSRWQVMGAIVQGRAALSTAQIARRMGLTRQAVQRVVNELAAEGIVAFQPNPDHKRAKLLTLTAKGTALFDEATARWRPIADALIAGLAPQNIEGALEILRHVRDRLDEVSTSGSET